jgi:hypothetical protein
MLILAQTSNFADEILKAGASKTVDWSIQSEMPLTERGTKLTVNISTLVFGTMKPVHFGISTAHTSRKPEAVSSSIMVIEGSRTSAVADAVVQSGIRIKAVPVLFIAKLVAYIIDRIHNVLLL